MKRYYWFTYPTAKKTLRNPKELRFVDIHRIRDVILPDLMEPLYSTGYRYGGTILNFPSVAPPQVDWESIEPNSESETLVDSGDILVACTRLPVNDMPLEEGGIKRTIDQSRTCLESRLHNAICLPDDIHDLDFPRRQQYDLAPPVFPPIFKHLDRADVELSSAAAAQLDDQKYKSLQFKTDTGVLARGEVATEEGTAITFLMTVPQIYTGGPRFLGAWGMGGRETFLWGYILRTCKKWRRLVEDMLEAKETRLIMAEFIVPKKIPYPFPLFRISPDPEVVADIRLPRP